MAKVILQNVSKIFNDDVVAVDSASLEISDREFMVIVGPSGCGKTTTLRMIAGLEDITTGKIMIGDRIVNDIPPKERDIAMVFQNYALYPHMTVLENMAFGLKLRHVDKESIRTKVMHTAKMLGIEELLCRKPKALSGGQRQRVALGRAIVRNPKAFLFDEPLSNLDAKLRVSTRAELKALHRKLATTSIYVTHDQAEAMTLGDRICVMFNGRIQQVAPPMDVYDRPVNRFVAGFLGTPPMNFIEGLITYQDNVPCFVSNFVKLTLPANLKDTIFPYKDRKMVLGVRPEHLYLEPVAKQNKNAISATVSVVEPLGDRIDVYLITNGGKQIIANIDPHVRVSVEQHVLLYVDVNKIHVFECGETGINVISSF
jgi:multiple sugar transport system ATP-binding protein